MKCPTLEQLAEYLTEPLPATLNQHVRQCTQCTRVIADLRRTVQAIETLPAPPLPDNLWGGVAARITARPVRAQFWWWRVAAGASVAASLALGLVLTHVSHAPALPVAPTASMAYSVDHQFLSAQDPLADRASLSVILASQQ